MSRLFNKIVDGPGVNYTRRAHPEKRVRARAETLCRKNVDRLALQPNGVEKNPLK